MSNSFLNSDLKTFQFKQFTVNGGNAGMPVSTDGVLLGAWANVEKAQRILDIGTGTGLLALMCAQRNLTCQINAVDIDQQAIDCATNNIQQSPWQERVSLDLGDITQLDFSHKFDHIICNPPYFNSGEVAQQIERATARHTLTLSHQDLLRTCKRLLSEHLPSKHSPSKHLPAKHRIASFILPFDEKENFLNKAKIEGLSPLRICDVKTTPNKPFSRVLFEFGHDANNHQLSSQQLSSHQDSLTIYRDGQSYSEEFIELTHAFYLKM